MRRTAALVSLSVLLAACTQNTTGESAEKADAPVATGGPSETREANTQYQPAFAGQTRAPTPAQATAVNVETVAEGLEKPWAVEFLPDGRMLVTEKPGRLRIVAKDGTLSPPVAGLPPVYSEGQGGLLDVAVSPNFRQDNAIYWTYAEPRQGGNGTSVAKARLVAGAAAPRVENVQVIFRQLPTWESNLHFGSRIVFTPEGDLYVTLGERSLPETRVQSQDLNGHLGKIVRIRPDGTPVPDNPFVGRGDAKPEIWSYGHRNIQGADLDAQGRLWTIEHGPRGGDELNRPEKGKNYGWPVITYGVEYRGAPAIGEGITQKEGMEQPVYYWDPVIAPGGMDFYEADLFRGWKGDALISGLGALGVVRVTLRGDRVVTEERIPLEARIRDVKVGPDGAVYAVDEDNGRILKLTPKVG